MSFDVEHITHMMSLRSCEDGSGQKSLVMGDLD